MKKITIFLVLCVLATQSFDLRSSSSEGVGSRVQHALTRTGRAVSQVVQDRIQDPLNGNKEYSAIFLISAELLKMWPSYIEQKRIIAKEQFAYQGALFRQKLRSAASITYRPFYIRENYPAQEIARLCCENPNARDMINSASDGEEAIHIAAWQGNAEALEVLLSAGARVDEPNYSGARPMHYAAAYGHAEALEVLLSNGAKVDASDLMNSEQPIHYAAYGVKVHALRVLLRHGANLRARDMTGWTPVHTLCARNDVRNASERRAALRALHAAAADDSMI